MRAEFYRPDAPAEVVGGASWTGSGVDIESLDEAVRVALEIVYRPTPVAVEDAAMRSSGSSGPVLLPPGSLQWFIHASRSRADAQGLAVRLVAEGPGAMGWDPAAAYRTFSQMVERKARMSQPEGR
jgi:hypothetical protein